eukprot:Gb_10207 [translate_table: standard]
MNINTRNEDNEKKVSSAKVSNSRCKKVFPSLSNNSIQSGFDSTSASIILM